MYEYEIRGGFICLPTVSQICRYDGQSVKYVYVSLDAIASIADTSGDGTCMVSLVNGDNHIVPATKDDLLMRIA